MLSGWLRYAFWLLAGSPDLLSTFSSCSQSWVALLVDLTWQHTWWWVAVGLVVIAAGVGRQMLVVLGQLAAWHRPQYLLGTVDTSWAHMLQSRCVPSTPELHQACPNCCCSRSTTPLICHRWCQWFPFSCGWEYRRSHLKQGCQTTGHQQLVGHRSCHISQQHYEALASESHSPVVPRWPFHLWYCQWEAWSCSGSTSAMQCWCETLAHSCMPASVSASWQSGCPSAFSDLLACSTVLKSQQWWLLLPFWIFHSLRVLQIHDPMAFPKSLTLLLIRICKY